PEAADLLQQERVLVGRRQLEERGAHGAELLVRGGGFFGRGGRRRRLRGERREPAAAHTCGAEVVEAPVAGDGEEPASETPLGDGRGPVAQHGEEHLLEEVLRRGAVADEAEDVSEEAPLVASVELVEGGQI